MRTSARNVFHGTIAACTTGAINTEVLIDLPGGDRLTAVVARESLAELSLAPGAAVVALVKAPWVTVLAGAGDSTRCTGNCLAGAVKTVEQGAVNAEVCIELAGGTLVHANVTREAVAELGLRHGTPATAVIQPSHVVLGVPTPT